MVKVKRLKKDSIDIREYYILIAFKSFELTIKFM